MSITFSMRKDGEFLEPDINMGERNAWAVMRALGYIPEDNFAEELTTPAQINEFIAKCDSVLASIRQFSGLDSGREAEESGGIGTGHVHFIDFGMRPGYIMEKVSQLRDLALLALEQKAALGWG